MDHYGICSQQAGININRLKWILFSFILGPMKVMGIQIYNPDLNSKKLILTADQINTSGLTTGIENIIWNQNRTENISIYQFIQSLALRKQREIIGSMI